MRCFYHGDLEAVAVCKSCGRGVCHDCTSEVGTGTACRNRCETDVEALNDMIERGKTTHQKASSTYSRNGLFGILSGAVFMGVGVFEFDGGMLYFFGILGGLFMIHGISQFTIARRYARK